MNTRIRLTLAALLIILPSVHALATGNETVNTTNRVTVQLSQSASVQLARMDQLLHLTADQQAKAADILKRKEAALARLQTEHRFGKSIQVESDALTDLRNLLSPDQQKTFDRTPTLQGGGLTIADPALRVRSLDREVGLTEAQKKVALQVFTEEFESLIALSPTERETIGARYGNAAHDQIRALLTPEQIAKQENNAAAFATRANEEITAIEKAVRSSTALAARVGSIVSLKRSGRSARVDGPNRRGDARFEVTGDQSTERIVVAWERTPATAPVKLTKMSFSDGSAVTP